MKRAPTLGRPAQSLTLLAAFWLVSGLRAAQTTDHEAAELSRAGHVLRERNRETMNPAEDPLVVIGLEQGGNDLRSRSPALLKSDRAATILDPDAAYERALALYEGRATFTSAPPALAPVRPRRSAAAQQENAEPGSPAATNGSAWSWRSTLPSLFLGALLVIWLYRRTMHSMQ